jgi:hypothetical protein
MLVQVLVTVNSPPAIRGGNKGHVMMMILQQVTPISALLRLLLQLPVADAAAPAPQCTAAYSAV